MSDAPLLQAVRGMQVSEPTAAEQSESGDASAPIVTLLDLGHDMHAALVQSVGITYGLPALCAVAASHRLLAEACRRDDVWRGLLKHALGITTRPMHVVAPTEQQASGSPCIAMMRALRRQPRKLVALMAKPAPSRLSPSRPVVRGLSATFPLLPRGRDHSVRADVPLPLVAQHTSCRVRPDGAAEVRLSSVAYFEVTIGAEFEPGGEHSDLCVAVGLCTDRFPLDGRMPGWDYHSCGFHGDDGFRFHGSGGNGNAFAEASTFEPGSVVGCGVLCDSHKVLHNNACNSGGSVVFYTVGGQLVGPAFMVPHLIRRLRRDPITEMPTPAEEPEVQKALYPVVGCDGSVALTLNFGATPFSFDPETAAAALREPRWAQFITPERMRSAFMLGLDEFESDLEADGGSSSEDDSDDDDDEEEGYMYSDSDSDSDLGGELPASGVFQPVMVQPVYGY